MRMIQYIFFDFGGCLDSDGIHTRALFSQAFLSEAIISADRLPEFQEAYSRADQKMMQSGIAKNMELREFNRLNGTLLSAEMRLPSKNVIVACDAVTTIMHKTLEKNRAVIANLAKKYQLGIISNFTGNLELILREYGLRDFFHSVTESFYVGASKPDLKIFSEALAKQRFKPEECLYVGDNPRNDIIPGKKMGMKCALIHQPGKQEECGADFYLEDLTELLGFIQSI